MRVRRWWPVVAGAAVLSTALASWLLHKAVTRIAFEHAVGGGALILAVSCALFVALVGIVLGSRVVYQLADHDARGGGR